MPTPEDVLGYQLGSRQATNQEIGHYWRVADQASDRVVTGVYAHSWQGRPLRYALVSSPSALDALDALPMIRQDLNRLRDPSTPEDQAEEIISRTPTILWIAANVHGNEPSGGDAVVRLLHELADRSDCVASAILDNAIVGLIPVQNPDGRAHDTRTNSYAFDMNRDVLVGTQPEVSGRLRLLWDNPPQLFVDEHENSGRGYSLSHRSRTRSTTRPRTGCTARSSRSTARRTPGRSRLAGGGSRPWRSGYDFFAQVYGDTVPTTQMGAVGMTFEQGDGSPYPARVRHQYTSALSTLYAGATHRASVLRTWRDTFVQAQAQGQRCHLEPNEIFNPGHELQRRVPTRPVCGYFLLGDSRQTRRVVSRLQTAHVEVDQLDRRTVVRDFRPYGDAPRRTSLPAGTYWVSLAQPQKHWVQAALNEDTYVPFPYFYDVSGWSLPLLAGIEGGSTGRPVDAPVSRVPTLDVPDTPRPPGRLPRIAVLDQFKRTVNDYQYSGWLKWRLAEDWRLPYDVLQPGPGHGCGAAQGRRPGRRERRRQAGVQPAGTPRPNRPARLGRSRRPLRRVAGGRAAGLCSPDLRGGHDHAEDEVAGSDDADRHPARTQLHRVGQRLQPRAGARRRTGGRRLPGPHVRLRIRGEVRGSRRHCR